MLSVIDGEERVLRRWGHQTLLFSGLGYLLPAAHLHLFLQCSLFLTWSPHASQGLCPLCPSKAITEHLPDGPSAVWANVLILIRRLNVGEKTLFKEFQPAWTTQGERWLKLGASSQEAWKRWSKNQSSFPEEPYIWVRSLTLDGQTQFGRFQF